MGKNWEEFAKGLSDDDLISEFGAESWSADRCVGYEEQADSNRALAALRSELLHRMQRGA